MNIIYLAADSSIFNPTVNITNIYFRLKVGRKFITQLCGKVMVGVMVEERSLYVVCLSGNTESNYRIM